MPPCSAEITTRTNITPCATGKSLRVYQTYIRITGKTHKKHDTYKIAQHIVFVNIANTIYCKYSMNYTKISLSVAHRRI